MSSGSYVYRPSFTEIAQMNIDRLNQEKSNLSELYKQTMSQIENVKKAIEKAQSVDEDFVYTNEQTIIDGLVKLEKQETYSGFSSDDLFFSDINIETGEITYVAIDYSDLISISNARNSTEFKKLNLASKLTKKAMAFVIDSDDAQKKVNDFIMLLNNMLDDKSINYEFFSEFINNRFLIIENELSLEKLKISSDEWNQYCALCALIGKRPMRIKSNEIQEIIQKYQLELMKRNYNKAARMALKDTFKELGLDVQGEYELENVCGTLYNFDDNSCKVFVSEEKNSFVFEMISNSETHSEEKATLCSKRKRISEIMEKKGFPVDVTAETDGFGASENNVSHYQKKNVSNIDRLRAKRTLEGKRGKAHSIGG